MYITWKISTYDPLKYIMDNPILIVLICMGKSTRMQRVKTYISDFTASQIVHGIGQNVNVY